MSFARSFYVPMRAAGIFLLLIAAVGCRKYVNESIEFEAWGFHNERYDMRSTDAVTVTYPIEGSGTINISEVKVQATGPGISSSFTQKDSDGVCRVMLTLRTTNTPGGSYPVRITIINENGSFIERTATIVIVNFVQLLNDTAARYYVQDTLSSTPFRPEWLSADYLYSTKVTHRAGDPANRFVFSDLGHVYNITTISDVIIDVDSITGVMTAPPQSTGISGYTGRGQLSKYDGAQKLKGHYIYTYRSGSGTNYEGHLSF